MSFTCRHGHALKETKLGKLQGWVHSRVCRYCWSSINRSAMRYHCSTCKLDVCKDCVSQSASPRNNYPNLMNKQLCLSPAVRPEHLRRSRSCKSSGRSGFSDVMDGSSEQVPLKLDHCQSVCAAPSVGAAFASTAALEKLGSVPDLDLPDETSSHDKLSTQRVPPKQNHDDLWQSERTTPSVGAAFVGTAALERLRVVRRWFEVSPGRHMEYDLVLPENFQASAPYPFLMCIPGGHQRDTEGVASGFGKRLLDDRWVVACPLHPGGGQQLFFQGKGSQGDGIWYIRRFADYLLKTFNVETGKFLMVGSSNGGNTILRFACIYPDLCRGLIPLTGTVDPKTTLKTLRSLNGLPIDMYVGSRDTLGFYPPMKQLEANLRTIRHSPPACLTVFDNAGHVPQAYIDQDLIIARLLIILLKTGSPWKELKLGIPTSGVLTGDEIIERNCKFCDELGLKCQNDDGVLTITVPNTFADSRVYNYENIFFVPTHPPHKVLQTNIEGTGYRRENGKDTVIAGEAYFPPGVYSNLTKQPVHPDLEMKQTSLADLDAGERVQVVRVATSKDGRLVRGFIFHGRQSGWITLLRDRCSCAQNLDGTWTCPFGHWLVKSPIDKGGFSCSACSELLLRDTCAFSCSECQNYRLCSICCHGHEEKYDLWRANRDVTVKTKSATGLGNERGMKKKGEVVKGHHVLDGWVKLIGEPGYCCAGLNAMTKMAQP